MSGKLFFTRHAVDRYIKRHDRSLTPEQARALLDAEGVGAVNTGKKSIKGDSDEWEIPALGITLLVKPDERLTADESPRYVVLTILPRYSPGMTFDAQLVEDLQREAQEVFDRVKAERGATVEQLSIAPSQERPALTERLEDLRFQREIAGSELAYIMNLSAALKRDHKLQLRTAHRDDNTRAMKESLRIAVRKLTAIAEGRTEYPYTCAESALREIEAIHADFITPKFYVKRAHPSSEEDL